MYIHISFIHALRINIFLQILNREWSIGSNYWTKKFEHYKQNVNFPPVEPKAPLLISHHPAVNNLNTCTRCPWIVWIQPKRLRDVITPCNDKVISSPWRTIYKHFSSFLRTTCGRNCLSRSREPIGTFSFPIVTTRCKNKRIVFRRNKLSTITFFSFFLSIRFVWKRSLNSFHPENSLFVHYR